MTQLQEIALFSYGTLRRRDVQLAIFGRALDGRADALAGHALSPMAIEDPSVVAISGAAVHAIARPSGDPRDRIEGLVFALSAAEIDSADRYESGPIERILARLESGTEAFVYVASDA